MKYWFAIFLVIFLCGVSGKAYASDSSESGVLSPTPLPEYSLPYSGILPDNPFYFLKVTRDRIISFLIADSLKKAEFNLLLADKRLGGGVGLFEKKNYVLAESTLSKGLNYFEESIIKIEEAEQEGRDIKPLAERIVLSMGKHKEVFSSLEKKSPEEFKKQLNILQERMETYEKRVLRLTPQE